MAEKNEKCLGVSYGGVSYEIILSVHRKLNSVHSYVAQCGLRTSFDMVDSVQQ